MSHAPTARLVGVVVVGVALLTLPHLATAADVATFESFYRKSWTASWVWLAVAAIATGGILFFTGGAATPVVAGIGTWIGGLFGYAGIAATNFGLALLGGGAVASGGLGILGGAAVITTVLVFSTDVVFDYSTSKVIETFQYDRFVEASRTMSTLPIPRNESGPPPYVAAMKVLEQANQNEPPSGAQNQRTIREAMVAFRAADTGQSGAIEDQARVASMRALLSFLANDYKGAKAQAEEAIQIARTGDLKRTLPAFIRAVSSLGEPQVDPQVSLDDLQYAIRAEPRNALVPVLVSVYLDRMMYRFNDGRFSAKHLLVIRNFTDHPNLVEHWLPIQISLLSYHMIRLKAEQQKISSLAGSSNETIRKSEKTLIAVKAAIEQYGLLLEGASLVVGGLAMPALNLDLKSAEEMKRMRTLLEQYSADRVRLQQLVDALKTEHPPEGEAQVGTSSQTPRMSFGYANPVVWLLLAALVAGGLGLGLGRLTRAKKA